MNIKNLLVLFVGLIAVLALWFGISNFSQAPNVVEKPVLPAGAASSPDMPFQYLKWGAGFGIRLWPTANPLTVATTTVCAIQSPAATSTMLSGGVRMTTSSTTASTVTLAKATTAFATTTLIGSQVAVAANAQTMITASTTSDNIRIFGPSEWFVVGMQGGVGSFSPVGTCHATFEEYGVGY